MAIIEKNQEICPHCGAKSGRGGKIAFHKKGCSLKTSKNSNLGFICCNQPMRRTDGANYDLMCSHGRLLTDDCVECRRNHYGVITFMCSVCGRQAKDAPHLAQPDEAFRLVNFPR